MARFSFYLLIHASYKCKSKSYFADHTLYFDYSTLLFDFCSLFAFSHYFFPFFCLRSKKNIVFLQKSK